MSKSKPLSRKYVEEYDSDDGFVEDAPASKKRKSDPKQKKELKEGLQKDDEGNEYWELSGKRRIQVIEFKKMIMIGVREFYEKDGKMLPGKKGIAMNVEQYTAFIELLPDIERVLKSRGVDVPRPNYDRPSQHAKDEEDESEPEEEEVEEDEEDNEEDQEAAPSKSKRKLDKFKMKSNHDATSDEDED